MSKGEEQIRKAMEEGQFENLPGRGKPLKLTDNPFEDPEWRMANKMLQEGGFTLPWIEKRQEIEQALKEARETLAQAWAWRKSALRQKQPYAFVQAEWLRAEKAFREKATEINKLVFDYNLEAPAIQFQLFSINIEREIEAITK